MAGSAKPTIRLLTLVKETCLILALTAQTQNLHMGVSLILLHAGGAEALALFEQLLYV